MDPRHTHKPTRVIREISRRTRTGTIPSLTVATQAHCVRQTPPTLPRNRTSPPNTWDLSKPLGLMSWCLPCLTFGKTQARNHDATLNGFSYCNADVSQSETSNKKRTPADERYSARFSQVSASSTPIGSSRLSDAVRCVNATVSRAVVVGMAVRRFSVLVALWFRRRRRLSCGRELSWGIR